MSDFGQLPKLKHIRETQRFYKNLWKDTGLFKATILRLEEAGITQTPSQT